MRRLNLQGFTYQTMPLPVLHKTFETKIYFYRKLYIKNSNLMNAKMIVIRLPSILSHILINFLFAFSIICYLEYCIQICLSLLITNFYKLYLTKYVFFLFETPFFD